jgi:PKD repeat protein
MKKQLLLFCFALFIGMNFFQSCKEDESTDPPKAGIFYSVVDKQVAFTALTKRVVTWNWDFGDGTTSAEQNPVHIYESGGYYTISLTGTDAAGSTAVAETDIAVALTPYVLLTGGPTAANGKTWKLTANHTANDKLANADADFTIADGAPATLPAGAFSLYLGMGEVYDDEYTFYFDGKYSHDVKADNAAFAGIVNQMLTNGGAGIVNAGGVSFGLCTGLYTPQTEATFTYVEQENFAVPSVYGAGGVLTYNKVSTLDFSGTEFVGFLDHQRKVIVQEITDNSMRLVMFMAASPDYFPMNTHALVLTFEVVK